MEGRMMTNDVHREAALGIAICDMTVRLKDQERGHAKHLINILQLRDNLFILCSAYWSWWSSDLFLGLCKINPKTEHFNTPL